MHWIKSRGGLRLAIRLGALLVGTGCAYISSWLMEEKEYGRALLSFTFIFVAAVVEFVFGDLIVEHQYPAETARRLKVFDQKIGERAANSIVNKIKAVIQSFAACDQIRI